MFGVLIYICCFSSSCFYTFIANRCHLPVRHHHLIRIMRQNSINPLPSSTSFSILKPNLNPPLPQNPQRANPSDSNSTKPVSSVATHTFQVLPSASSCDGFLSHVRCLYIFAALVPPPLVPSLAFFSKGGGVIHFCGPDKDKAMKVSFVKFR
jgi:hypothetical protein